jgi:hypothetical protein
MRSKKFCSAARSVFTIFVAFVLVSAIAAQPAQAQTFKVLHTFHGKDGASPEGGWPTHAGCLNSKSTYRMIGGPSFRVLCGRVGDEDAGAMGS